VIVVAPSTVRFLLVVVAMLLGVIVGLVAWILARTGGAPHNVAVTRGGVAFGGTVSLALLIESSLGVL
jgi:hypothetical protein